MDSDRLVEDNIRLVYYMVKKLGKTDFVMRNKEDITSEGVVGLIKAAKSFDESKEIKFATYASRCIMNQILMYMRRCKKQINEVSLDAPLVIDSDSGSELTYADIIPDERSDIDLCINRIDLNSRIVRFYNGLDKKHKRIFKLRLYGLKHRQIAVKVGFSQSYVSRLLSKMKKEYKKLKYKEEINAN